LEDARIWANRAGRPIYTSSEKLLLEGAMFDYRNQVVTGVVPPSLGEALIREAWPSVAAFPAAAGAGRALICSIILAPLGWFLLAPFYFAKILPFLAKRYTLTNRRLMIQRGLKAAPTHEIALEAIDDVRIHKDANSDFYRSGTLEVISRGQPAMKLPGVPEPESFQLAIIQACKAWVPGKASAPIVAASASSGS
jgi:hypothetical protein